MKRFYNFLIVFGVVSIFVISCAKKPLTLDNETSMKTLLKASDDEIAELVMEKASKIPNVSTEEIEIEYILRDKENQAIVVKSKISKQKR